MGVTGGMNQALFQAITPDVIGVIFYSFLFLELAVYFRLFAHSALRAKNTAFHKFDFDSFTAFAAVAVVVVVVLNLSCCRCNLPLYWCLHFTVYARESECVFSSGSFERASE